jgi:hypothetical protein
MKAFLHTFVLEVLLYALFLACLSLLEVFRPRKAS